MAIHMPDQVPVAELPVVAVVGVGVMLVTFDSASVDPEFSPSDTLPLATCTDVTTPVIGLLLASKPATVLPIIDEAELIEVCKPKFVSDVCRLVEACNCPIWLICASRSLLLVGFNGS